MVREEIFAGLKPQAQRPITNLFGDTQWTYKGQEKNQLASLDIPRVTVDDGVPLEFARSYAMLAMSAGKQSGIREISRTALIILIIGYFAPSWVLLILMPFCIIAIFYSQKNYREAFSAS